VLNAQKAAPQVAYAKRTNVRLNVRLGYLMEVTGQRPQSLSLFLMLVHSDRADIVIAAGGLVHSTFEQAR
jgi:hypothetical protein